MNGPISYAWGTAFVLSQLLKNSCAVCPMVYPTSPTKPSTLYAIHGNIMTTTESITLQSLSGGIAKVKSPVIYRIGDSQYDLWLEEIKKKTDIFINSTFSESPSNLIDFLVTTYTSSNFIIGMVTYVSPSDVSLSQAITYCAGSTGVFAVQASDADFYSQKYGLSVLFHAENDELPESLIFSENSITFQQPSAQPFLTEYSVFSGSPYLAWDDVNRDKHLARISKSSKGCAAAYGWVGDEGTYVTHLTQYGVFVHASDWAKNMSPLSNINVALPPLPAVTPPTTSNTAVHTVTFVMTDGDNFQWLLGSFLQSSWYGAAEMQSTPMGFTIAPALVKVAPVSLSYIYEQATSNTSFVAAPSGLGYCYPELLSSEVLNSYSDETSDFMSQTNLRILNILAGNDDITDFTLKRSSTPFLQHNNIDGVFYYTYGSGYAGGRGKTIFDSSSRKPIITARFSLWDDGDDVTASPMLGNDAMIEALRGQVKDATLTEGYSLVSVHAWSHTTADVKYIIESLREQDSAVEVLTPEAFLLRFKQNVKII